MTHAIKVIVISMNIVATKSTIHRNIIVLFKNNSQNRTIAESALVRSSGMLILHIICFDAASNRRNALKVTAELIYRLQLLF